MGEVLLAELFEWKLAIVLPEEIQELLVVGRLDVEQLADDLVVALGFLQALADHVPDVLPGNLARHVERVDGGPERFAVVPQPLVQVVDDGLATLALRLEAKTAALHPDFRRQVLGADLLVPAGDDQALDDVLELADVAGPGVVAERLEGVSVDPLHEVTVAGGEAGEEVLDQARDVFLAL